MQQFCLCPCSLNAAVIHHDDLVGIHDGGKPVGNDNQRLASHESCHALLNDGFVLRVGVGGRFVQNDDRCVF